MTSNTKPAYLYARYSSANQKEDSTERQLRYGREMIERQGWRLVEELKDEAVSAFKGANRAAGSALYEFERRAREGEFVDGAVLVCENVDRLSRQGAKASARLIWSLNEMGVDVATYHDGHVYKAGEDTELMDLFSVIIKGALGREESTKKSKRSQAHWDKTFQAIQDGRRTAHSRQCPAWIDIVDGRYVLNDHRAKIVRQMYEWYCNGLGSHQILYKLMDMGELCWSSEKRYKNVKQWTVRYIHKVLTARQVIGEYVTIKGETLATDFYPAVVDIETFNKAQAMRKTRSRSGGDAKKRSENLFVNLAKCGECGKSATVAQSKRKSGALYRYLRCNEARYRHVPCQNFATVRYEVLEETVLSQVLSTVAGMKEREGAVDQSAIQLAEWEREKQFRQTQIDNIVGAISDGNAPKALMLRLSSLEAEIEALDLQIIRQRSDRAADAFKPVKSVELSIVEELRQAINSDDTETRLEARASVNAALCRLIKRIDINPDDTFTIRPDDSSEWHFLNDGTLIEGQYALAS
ncbi:recombinase family protein [uncultured Novosphingobium sp.]|uniref:recombinase family protein n=1 Tax=uncultured Novosphingobium sp. TaxID=292277 RepID=UPI002586550A|nr:recombinase family protein [uncultured Novosphingobium sp.]